jgi:hypothetical protein
MRLGLWLGTGSSGWRSTVTVWGRGSMLGLIERSGSDVSKMLAENPDGMRNNTWLSVYRC